MLLPVGSHEGKPGAAGAGWAGAGAGTQRAHGSAARLRVRVGVLLSPQRAAEPREPEPGAPILGLLQVGAVASWRGRCAVRTVKHRRVGIGE